MAANLTSEQVLVVVPAFNEAKNIGEVLSELAESQPKLKVLVVDDGSTDNTSAVAASHSVSVLTLPFNLGVGAAMRLGFKFAVQNGFSVVVQVDADGQHIPSQIDALLRELEEFDVVIGSRFANENSDFEVGSSRRFAMKFLAFGISPITKSNLTDVTSGFRAAGPSAVPVFANSYPPEYLGDTIESLVIAHRQGLKITEVATSMRPRMTGSSSQSTIKALIYTLRALVVLALSLLHRAPISSKDKEQN